MAHTDRDGGRTAHPDTTAAAMRRRAFVSGVGASAAGLAAGVAAAGGPDDGDDERDGHEAGDRTDGDRGRRGRRTEEFPDLIAHRGFAGMYPENTVGAVTRAARGARSPRSRSRAAQSIEIDVVATADGDVVVFHDDRLAGRDGGERGLTDAEGLVWETDTETVTDAEVLDSGETVPLLSTVLDAIPRHIGVNVELKNPGSGDLRFAANLSGSALETQAAIWRPFVNEVLDVVDEYHNDVLFSSFYEAALATTREASDYPVAPLLWDSIEDGLAIAEAYDAEAIHPPYNMVRGTPFYADEYYTEGSEWSDTDLLAVAHDAGRDVNVYTIGTWYQAERLSAAGVDGLIADYPGLLRFGAERRDD
jgi:glycerophosphoryl diester phosphodiesterase